MASDVEEALEIARREVLRSLAKRGSRGSGGMCCSIPLEGGVIEAKSLREIMDSAEGCRVTVVFFDSPTCPYCRIFRPQFYEAAEAYGDRAAFVRILVTEAPDAAMAFGVMGVPTVSFLRRGREVDRIIGLPLPGQFEATIERLLEKEECPTSRKEGSEA